MRRSFLLVAAGLLLACGLVRAPPTPSRRPGTGNSPSPPDGEEIILMIAFTEKDGKWIGEYLTASQELRIKPKFKSLKVDRRQRPVHARVLRPRIRLLRGLLSKDKKKLNGSLSLLGGKLTLDDLYPSKLKKLDDPFELARETLTQIEDGPEMFDAAFAVLAKAGAKKLPADEARAIVDRVNKAASTYGPRWERDVTLRLVEVLAGQEGLGDVAIAQAKRAERLLTDDDTAATRMKVLEAVARTLTKAGKPDDAKPYTAQIAKLEPRDFAEYTKTLPFKPEAFAGRKGKSDPRWWSSVHRGRVPAVRRRRSRVRRAAEGVQAGGRDPAAVPLPHPRPRPAHQPRRR